MNRHHLLAGVAACLATSQVSAIELMGSDWQGEGEFGYVATTGNTETTNLKASLGLVNERPKWRHTANLEGLNSSEDDNTTAERYAAAWQTDYKFREHEYVFGRLYYETDKFSGYEYRASEVIGYGRRVLNTDTMTLDLEGGPGARQSKLENDGTDNEMILRLVGRYAWKISPNARFTEDLSFDVGEEATITRSVTALKADIVGNLAMKLSLTVENTSDVPAGVDKTDTETAVTLVYSF